MPAAATCTGLYVAAKEQKESEHGGRVEVDLAFAGDHRKAAEGISTTNGNGDRHIHAQYPRAQITHCIAEERQSRKEYDWCSESKREPVEEGKKVWADALRSRYVDRDGEHHHLHHAGSGHNEAANMHALFMMQPGLGFVGLVGLRLIADGSHFRQQL